ncbi:hypothetical protein Tco_0907477 [Tanacetum coccineum]|uniref:Uncharacterized protein n=1 Tax=Tanacetum coccineum TaxID=301880 RepID=A0ABQ5CKU8_9ASTR
MTGNIAHLSDFKDFDGGYVTFGGGAYGGRITGKGTLDFDDVYFVKELKFNLFSVSQMCDKKNYVLFTDSECLVLSPNCKLLDENQILLKIPRQDNMYSFDMKNIVPKDSLTCLVAKATSEESMLCATVTKLILRVKKLESKLKAGTTRKRARVVLSEDDEDVEDDSSKQGRKLSDAEVQEKASTETEPIIQEVYCSWHYPMNINLPSTSMLQRLVSRLAILGVVTPPKDLNVKILKSLPSEWDTHVVVWMNKLDFDTMGLDDLYNNFKSWLAMVMKSAGANAM